MRSDANGFEQHEQAFEEAQYLREYPLLSRGKLN